MNQEYSLHPTWWNDQHNTAWERVREALKRDWEQTKADLTKDRGHDLNQSITDTVKQAVGVDPLPLRNAPTPHGSDEKWDQVAHAMRYGHGAGVYYGEHREWDGALESKLNREWEELKSGHTWDDMSRHVRHGWQAARDKR